MVPLHLKEPGPIFPTFSEVLSKEGYIFLIIHNKFQGQNFFCWEDIS